jgi:hypothetical protein
MRATCERAAGEERIAEGAAAREEEQPALSWGGNTRWASANAPVRGMNQRVRCGRLPKMPSTDSSKSGRRNRKPDQEFRRNLLPEVG